MFYAVTSSVLQCDDATSLLRHVSATARPLSTPRYSTYTNCTGHGSSGSWVNHSAPPGTALTRTPRVMDQVGHGSTTQHPQVRHLHELHGSWVTWVMGQPLSTPIRCGTYTNPTGHWVTWVMGQQLSTSRCGSYTNSAGHGSRGSWVSEYEHDIYMNRYVLMTMFNFERVA